MATLLTQGHRPADFILTEANGQRSRENGVLAAGQKIVVGQCVQKRLDGKFIAADGVIESGGKLTTDVEGVSIYAVDATAADKPFSFMARECELNAKCLTFPVASSLDLEKPAVIASLAKRQIIVRD